MANKSAENIFENDSNFLGLGKSWEMQTILPNR